MVAIFLIIVATLTSCVACQQLPLNYSGRSVAGAGAGVCLDTQGLRDSIKQNIHSLINNSVLPALMAQNQTQTVPGVVSSPDPTLFPPFEGGVWGRD